MKIIIEISKGILVVAIIFIISPLLVFLTILSFLDTGKFPIFIQVLGLTLNKYRFKIFKFRTIKDFPTKILINSNSNLKRRELLEYISPFGRFLRKSGLDELPQLFNIFLGQVNLFGPRSLSIDDLKMIKTNFPELYERREKLNSKPGLLGLWQVRKDFECSVHHLVRLDEEFDQGKSIALILKIFFKTFEMILLGYHIDSIVNGDKVKVYPVVIYATIISCLILIFFVVKNTGI